MKRIVDFITYDIGNKINEAIDPKIRKRLLTDLKLYCDDAGKDYPEICQSLGLSGYDKISSLTSENVAWLDEKIGQGVWEINEESGKIDLDGSLDLRQNYYTGRKKIDEIPEGINFGSVSGGLFIDSSDFNNPRGLPDSVNGDVKLDLCGFSDLKFLPKNIGGSVMINNLKSLTSLEGCPEEIKKSFSVINCKQLKSLEGGPKKVKWEFKCSNCSLTTLVGGPIEVGSSFHANNNELSTLEGFPKTYNGMASELLFDDNQLFSLDGIDLKKIPDLNNMKKNLYPAGVLKETAMKAREFGSWTAAYLWLITTEKFQRMSKAQRDPIREMLSGDNIRYRSMELSKIWKDDIMKDPAVKRILIRAGIMDRSGNFIDSDFEEFGGMASDLSDLGF
jgi:hypothetical protein